MNSAKANGITTGYVWTVGGCALLHFLVDGLCLCCLLLVADLMYPGNALTVFVLYNVMAFLTQPLTGLLADRVKHLNWLLVASLLLLTLGTASAAVVSSPLFEPLEEMLEPLNVNAGEVLLVLLALLLGAGNSLFHVWGGRLVATTTRNNMRALGAFVATGAFGLAVSAVFFSWPLLWLLLLAMCLMVGIVLRGGSFELRGTRYEIREYQINAEDLQGVHSNLAPRNSHLAPRTSHLAPRTSHLASRKVRIVLVLLVMLVVMLRSWLGAMFTTPAVEQTEALVLLVGFVAMAGKAAGGWLCHWLGLAGGVVLMIVGTAAGCFMPASTLLPLVGLFFVNCTMPVTLWLANLLLPGREGLAFGLLAAALIPGYLLALI